MTWRLALAVINPRFCSIASLFPNSFPSANSKQQIRGAGKKPKRAESFHFVSFRFLRLGPKSVGSVEPVESKKAPKSQPSEKLFYLIYLDSLRLSSRCSGLLVNQSNGVLCKFRRNKRKVIPVFEFCRLFLSPPWALFFSAPLRDLWVPSDSWGSEASGDPSNLQAIKFHCDQFEIR